MKNLENLKWETVPLEGFPENLSNNFQGFVGLEECTDYGMEKENKSKLKKKSTDKRKRNNEENFTKVQVKKLKLSNGFIVEDCSKIKPSLFNDACTKNITEMNNFYSNLKSSNTVKQTKSRKLKLGENIDINTSLTEEDMLSWAEFKLPEEILKALMEQGFKKPTKIQQLILPAAIHGRRDILGAAETGSGKTLAFGLPIISGILKLKEKALAKNLDVYEIPFKKTSVKGKNKNPEIQTKESKTKGRKQMHVHKQKNQESENVDECINEEEDSDDESEVIGETDDESNENITIETKRNKDTLHLHNDIEKSENSDEDFLSEDNHEGMGCVKVIDNIEIPGATVIKTGKPLYALILTPTRELAMQISRHLIAVAKYTGVRVATIVGGMAGVKQERVLRSGPEIVVATPGRLWELIQQGESHLQQLNTVKFLAIDETDRMIERGHFEELQPLLERLNVDETMQQSRQNFVMSATLTMVHDLPAHMKGKKITKRGKILNRKVEKMTPQQKIKRLIDMIGMTDPKVVDITTQNSGTAETLTECRISCAFEHKDMYLYYILKRHPGRTIVFCNSIGCVKRLAQLFTILKCRPLPLHAGMPQRQRLKNLERLRDDPHSVLIATDVAARGLDIPNVDHVIHYQVPRTAENYVHRSGRTARANKEGLTILMMEPSEAFLYGKLCRTLNKTTELPMFPVSAANLASVKMIVAVARDLDTLMLKKRRGAQESGWREKMAKEMDMIIDDDVLPVKELDPGLDKALEAKKKQLENLMSRPLFPKGFSFKYPTLNDPSQDNHKDENALQVMKRALESGEIQKEKRKGKNAALLSLQETFSGKCKK